MQQPGSAVKNNVDVMADGGFTTWRRKFGTKSANTPTLSVKNGVPLPPIAGTSLKNGD
jgi:hypothetical protein